MVAKRQQVVFEDENDQANLIAGQILEHAQQKPGEPEEPPVPIPPQPEEPEPDEEEVVNEPQEPDDPEDDEAVPQAEPQVVYPAAGTFGEIIPPAVVTYRQRIRVVEAYQYHGRLSDAPVWVDRNWAAWGEYDPLRSIQPGPAVRVPNGDGAAICRIGDYIVQQEVMIAEGISDTRIEVWAREQFEKFFLPV